MSILAAERFITLMVEHERYHQIIAAHEAVCHEPDCSAAGHYARLEAQVATLNEQLAAMKEGTETCLRGAAKEVDTRDAWIKDLQEYIVRLEADNNTLNEKLAAAQQELINQADYKAINWIEIGHERIPLLEKRLAEVEGQLIERTDTFTAACNEYITIGLTYKARLAEVEAALTAIEGGLLPANEWLVAHGSGTFSWPHVAMQAVAVEALKPSTGLPVEPK